MRKSAITVRARRQAATGSASPVGAGAEHLERLVEVRVGAGRERVREGHDDVRRQPDGVDPALVGRQPARDGQLERAAFAAELLPLLDGALAERLLADERGPLRVLQRARDDLARRRAAAVDEDDELDLRVGGDAVAERFGRDLPALRVLLPEEDARADELAGDLARRRDVAAGVAAQVEDQLRPAGREVGLQRRRRPRRRTRPRSPTTRT